MKLRDYQQQGIDAVKALLRRGVLHIIRQAPTGAGKTVEFSYIAQGAAKKGKRVLILTNRTELLTQTGGALSSFGVKPYLIRAGTNYINFNHNVYVAMCMTLRNRLDKPLWRNWLKNSIDMIIIDEAHLQDFNYIFESELVDDKPVLGFTATPQHTGAMRQLGLDYEEIVETVSVKDLVNRGHLVCDDYAGVKGVDMNNVKYDSKKGDYSESDMFSRFNTPKLYAGVVKNWLEIAPNTHTIVFCVNIEHAIHTCEEFHKHGIDARFMVSKMSKPKEPAPDALQGLWTRYAERMRLYTLYLDSFGKWSGERNYITNKFKKKDFPVLINAGIYTTGFDCPAIETVIVNRATLSMTLWSQMIGRGSRTFPGKTHFNLLDFGDNAQRLGHYMAPKMWSLWHEPANTGGGVAPVKVCGDEMPPDKNGKDGCNRMILGSYRICPFCGYIYPSKKAMEVALVAAMYDTEKHAAVAVKRISDMDIKELVEYREIKGHKQPWLWRQLYFRGGVDLIKSHGTAAGWSKGTIAKAVNYTNGL